jgi:hypothetical protein
MEKHRNRVQEEKQKSITKATLQQHSKEQTREEEK